MNKFLAGGTAAIQTGMATVLQQQLAVIAASSTHQLDLKAQKSRHGQSLLFEPRDAANQSFDTIFQICADGFEELCQLDGRYAQYGGRTGIFSQSSKEVDRTQLTAKENQELDFVLDSALGLLQGRLLLKPAIKCVEWLVRRFRIHEYNTEATLLAFLPYHTTDMFPTLLSILPSQQLPPTFKWLHPYVASLRSPPRSAILSAISANSAFFTAFNSWVVRIAKAKHHSAILLGFWASLNAQAVNGIIDSTASGRDSVRRQREEDMLLRVLPILQQALGITGIPELYLGACMIITILVTKSRLGDKVLDALMEAVAGAWIEETFDEGLTCLAVAVEEKEGVQIPGTVTRALLKHPDIIQRLQELGHSQRVGKLAAGFAITTFKLGCKTKGVSKIGIAEQILSLNILDEQYTLLVLQEMIMVLTMLREADDSIDVLRVVSGTLERLTQDPEKARMVDKAAEDSKVDIQALHVPLSRNTAGAKSENSTMEIDESEKVDIKDDTQARYDVLIRSLPRLPAGAHSFLGLTMPYQTFHQYANVWEIAQSSDHNKNSFMAHDQLQGVGGYGQTSLLTFLARVWASRSTSIEAKTSALNATKTILDATQLHGAYSQSLLPYTLVALSDTSVKVRRAAASLCSSVQFSNKAGAAASVTKDIYGRDDVRPHRLNANDIQVFMRDILLSILEDCVLDATFASRALVDVLNNGAIGSQVTSSAPSKELKKSLRVDLCIYLATHAVATPVMPVRLTLLRIFNNVGKSALQARKDILLPFARRWSELSPEDVRGGCDEEGVTLGEMDKAVLGTLTHRTSDEVQLLKKIASKKAGRTDTILPVAYSCIRQLFPMLKSSQAEMTEFLLDQGLSDEGDTDTQSLALDAVRLLPLPTEVLVHLLENLPNANELQDQPPSAKKQRNNRTDNAQPRAVDEGKVQTAVRRIVVVLELLESSKPERHPQLLSGLFNLLGELHHYKSLTASELVYLHQMLFGCLISIVDTLNGSQHPGEMDVDKSVIRTDLIVECLRTTKSTQIHNLALLLVSKLASWTPDLVLHSVMPLFTFMSSTVLRQSDDYSALVADEAVGKIVPPLAQSLKNKGKDVVMGAAELLLSFTAAYEHIPLHRRLGLFHLLITTLGEQDALFAVLAMLIERYPSDDGIQRFLAELSMRMQSVVVLGAANQYLDLVADGLKPKKGLSDVLLAFNEKSKDQILASTETLVEGLASLLQNEVLRSRLAVDLSTGDSAGTRHIRTLYADLLERAMQSTQIGNSKETVENATTLLLRTILGLLPTGEFIQSSAQLMQSGSDATRQQVFRSLESRAQAARRGDKVSQRIFLDVLPGCIVYISDKQAVMTRHAAIACIDQITEKFGRTNTAAVVTAAEQVAGDAALGSVEIELRIISLLGLASMVEVLGDEAIGILPKVLDQTISYLEECLTVPDANQQLLDAGFSLLNAVLGTLPWMLSASSLDRALKVADHAATVQRLAIPDHMSAPQGFCDAVARKISPAEVFAAIERTWAAVLQLDRRALVRHLQILQDAIKYKTKATITKNAPILFRILLEIFDLRRHVSNIYEDEQQISLINSIAMDLTLKLNDATFRPFFMQLIPWATRALPTGDTTGELDRLISVYSFSLKLFEQLKSLVTSYASFLLENSAQLLVELKSENNSERRLLELVLQTLSSSFRHDQDDFWQAPAHFEEVVMPLVRRLEVSQHLDVSVYIIPTIADLASAASSPELFKALNSRLISVMKHSDAHVRLAAVKCERAITEKLSLEWLMLLPELLPVISELLEDDAEDVEREVLRWVKEIEEVTGENLEGMLS